MNPQARASRVWTIVLLLVCIALALAILRQLDTGHRLGMAGDGRVAQTQPPINALAALEAPSLLAPLEDFSEIVDRPLFSETRRPYEPEEGEVAAEDLSDESGQESQRLVWQLVGVMISPQGREALVQHNVSKESMKVEQGEALDGWTVEQVSPGGVILSQGSRRHELELRDYEEEEPPAKPARRKRRPTRRR